MRITYDAQVDALCLVFAHAEIVTNRELVPGIIVNMDAQGHAVGVEVLGARERIGADTLRQITIDLRAL